MAFDAGDFQSDLPLHPKAEELLHTFFEQGWMDPGKVIQGSGKVRILIEQAKEEIAAHLGCQPRELEFVGEIGFGFWSALAGLLSQEKSFIYSVVDRQVVHAFARQHRDRGGAISELPVDHNGSFVIPHTASRTERVISWQHTNRENGVVQSKPSLSSHDQLFVDMTSASPLATLPEGWSVALWDPRSFAGPQGLAIMAISQSSKWRSPIPPMDHRRLYGSYSKPLLLATAIALTNTVEEMKSAAHNLSKLSQFLREGLARSIADIRMLPHQGERDPRFLAFAIPGVIGEEIVRAMEKKGFLLDAGSACGAGALSPSHVLDALGWQNMAHLRITLKNHHTSEDVNRLVSTLETTVKNARA